VVTKFFDVLPKELSSMPLDRSIEFVIELAPDIASMYKRSYWVAAKQLVELKDQIKELLEKGYIRPSSPPRGAPMIFVLKKDGTQPM
jgi:hypothetical protein